MQKRRQKRIVYAVFRIKWETAIFLKKLTRLIKDHHKHSLGKLSLGAWQKADGKRAERRDHHQKVLVKDLPVQNIARGAPQHVMTHREIRGEIQRKP